MSQISGLTRRQILGTAGAAGVALMLGNQNASQQGNNMQKHPALRLPKRPPAGFYMTKHAVLGAARFKTGNLSLPLELEEREAYVSVNAFPLRENEAKKLNRQENIIETIGCPISDPASIGRIRRRIAQLKAPNYLRDKSSFFFIRAGQRVYEKRDLALRLTIEHKLSKEREFVLGIANNNDLLELTLLFQGGRDYLLTVGSFLKAAPLDEPEEEESTPPQTSTYPQDQRIDFAECYSDCIKNVPEWLITIAGAICSACIGATAAAVIPGTQPVSVPALIAACGGCVASLGVVLGNCLLTCHEMLGE